MSVRSLGLLIASFLLAFAVAASAAPAKKTTRHHEKRPDKASGPALVVRGDQVSTEGLVDAVAKGFDATGDGHLDVQPFNTIDGIDQALSGQVDLAASARPAYAGRPQEAGLTFTPVAWDALVLITNVANPVNNLTLKQVHNIYYGQVKNWSQVGGPDEPIDLDGVASPLDGVQYSFRELMFGNGDNPVAVPRLFINIDSLQSEVSLDTKALALSTLVHARRQKDIKIIPIEGVMPTLATLENGSYPLPLRIYLAYKPDSPKIATIQKFLAFIGSPPVDGILRGHDLLPYAQATVLNAQSELDRINVIGARMVAEGLPPAYAPGNEFARLAALHGQSPGPADLARTAAIQRAAANQATAADQQRVALSEAAGVDPSPVAGAAAAAPVAAPAVASAAPVQSIDYTVVSGDTLSKIARKHSVSVEDLKRWNNLHSDNLKVGQVLKVSPSRSSASTGGVTCSTTC